MQPILNIAIRAARAAGAHIVRHLDRLDAVAYSVKGPNDLVSQVDHEAERKIIGVVRKAYPSHAILAEESGASGKDEFEWIIDPLDGTMNFLHGFPHFAVSVAVRRRGVLDQGVVFDPVRQELFAASRGAGARVDDRRIRVGRRQSLKGALLGTGFPFKNIDQLDRYLDTLRALTPKSGGIRRAGSAALDLAYVAAGRLDGFWEFGLSPWDFAAGVLLVREAGGLITDAAGGDALFESGDIVAGNPKVLAGLLRVLAPSPPRAPRRN